ncbi:MAG: carotenoid 1,2-hydratase [Rubrivivax sp.]|nr:carotenoid 1,2-hydratase [Rubrivivax sp.]
MMAGRRRAGLLLGTSGLGSAIAWPVRGLAQVAAAGPAIAPAGVRRGRRLAFPRDHGAHPDTRLEWWYLTGWLAAAGSTAPTHGFQVTFFRSRTAFARAAEGAGPAPGRFVPNHLLLAHAALTDLTSGRHHHAQRIGRWNGEPAAGPDRAALHDAAVHLAGWQLARGDTDVAAAPGETGAKAASAGSSGLLTVWTTRVRAEGFALAGSLRAAQPLLLQGDAGFSRKGPGESQASHYYSWPQLHAELTLELHGQRVAATGRGWLDHEWSDTLMHPHAVGWDWIGINLADGSALTAFHLRRADGSALWAGGSHRTPAAAGPGVARIFEAGEVRFEPGRRWRSPATHAAYPVDWQVHTPVGRFGVRALLDGQELAGRPGSGAVYWEGLAELLDAGDGRRIGLGYLEMTGYAAPLKLS